MSRLQDSPGRHKSRITTHKSRDAGKTINEILTTVCSVKQEQRLLLAWKWNATTGRELSEDSKLSALHSAQQRETSPVETLHDFLMILDAEGGKIRYRGRKRVVEELLPQGGGDPLLSWGGPRLDYSSLTTSCTFHISGAVWQYARSAFKVWPFSRFRHRSFIWSASGFIARSKMVGSVVNWWQWGRSRW